MDTPLREVIVGLGLMLLGFVTVLAWVNLAATGLALAQRYGLL
jgi:hypothetical protein